MRQAANVLSLLRVALALFFATIAFQFPSVVVAAVYGSAALTDTLDGAIARRLGSETYFGKVVDLVSDKSLTIVSILFAAARGVTVFPLALIGAREMVVMGMRILSPEGVPVLGTSRIFGGVMATALWGNTMMLIVRGQEAKWFAAAEQFYWLTSLIFMGNLIWRIAMNASKLKDLMRQNQNEEPRSPQS